MLIPRSLSRATGALLATAVLSSCGDNGPKPPTAIAAASAITLTGVVNVPLGTVPKVKVTDADGNGVANVAVLFTVLSGGGIVGGATTVTNASGEASPAAWTLGTKTGLNTLTAAATGLTGSPVTFTATGTAGPPAAITVLTGNNQTVLTGTAVPTAPSVRVADAQDNSVPNASVTFAVASGGGSVSGATATTNASGVATVGSWTLGSAAGANTLSATVAGAPTVTATVNANAVVSFAVGSIQPLGGDRQAVMAGSALPTAPSVLVAGTDGAPLPGIEVTFSVFGGGGSITGATATTNASGIATVGSWTLGATGGLNTMRATATNSNVAAATFTASGCTGAGPGYQLTLCIVSEMTATQKNAFTLAAARWAQVITTEASDATVTGGLAAGSCSGGAYALASTFSVDDLLIFASVVDIDGPGQILGSAGPCLIRRAGTNFAVGDFPVVGSMRFDVADILGMEQTGILNPVILHEMGHVIGLGTLWEPFGFLVNKTVLGNVPEVDTHFNGANAIAGFNDVGGTAYNAGAKVPVENRSTSGAGSINGHWRELVMRSELMTPTITNNQPAAPISLVTVQSLKDLGYSVNLGAADAFNLSTAGPSLSIGLTSVSLLNDLYTGPLYALDRRGRLTRVR